MRDITAEIMARLTYLADSATQTVPGSVAFAVAVAIVAMTAGIIIGRGMATQP